MDERLLQLTAQLLDQSLSLRESKELLDLIQQSDEARRIVAAEWIFHQSLAEIKTPCPDAAPLLRAIAGRNRNEIKHAIIDTLRDKRRPPRRKSLRSIQWIPRLAMAATLVIGLGVASLLFYRSLPAPVATLSSLKGITLTRSHPASNLAGEQVLREGDVVYAQSDSTLHYDDGTSIITSPGTRIRLEKHVNGKNVFLKTGQIECDVTPQPDERPMHVHTEDGVITVIGTRFTATTSTDGTSVDVDAGRVLFTSPALQTVINANESYSSEARELSSMLLSESFSGPDINSQFMRKGFLCL